MKKVGYSERTTTYIPICSFSGDNMTSISSKMNWYKGPTLAEAIDNLSMPKRYPDKPLRVPVLDVYKIAGVGTVVIGRISTGMMRP